MPVRPCTVAVLAVLAVLLASPAASAHPLGPPPTALVTARGRSVFIEWRAAADDAIAIGVDLGLVPEGAIEAYRGASTQVAPAEEDELELTMSPELERYLLEHIEVRQDGAPCTGRVPPMTNFVAKGTRVVYECPDPVEAVELEISMLHELHEAYRTFALSGDGALPKQAVFTRAEPVHTWRFGAEETATNAPAADDAANRGGEGPGVAPGTLGRVIAALAGAGALAFFFTWRAARTLRRAEEE